MEWRIILPVLCLIAATTSPTSVMSQTTNLTAPAKVAKINLRFSIVQDFKEIYNDLNNNETKILTSNITTECSKVYQSRFQTFAGMNIQKLSQGSIVVDSVLDFNTTNGSAPNATEVKDILVAAIRVGNFSNNITSSSVNATDFTPNATTSPPPATNQTATPARNQTATPATNQTAPPATNQTAPPATNQTATPATNQTATPVTSQTAPANVAKINLGFSITKEFKAIYSDLSNPETKSLTTNITNEFTPVYKKRFANFLSMAIRKFSQGSIVVDSVLEFNSTTGTAPNATDVKDTLVTAIRSGNFSFQVSNSSINATDITPNATTSPPPATNQTAPPATNQTATPATNQTAPPATNQTATPATNQTATPATNQTATPATSQTAPANVAKFNLGFSIAQEFKDIYSDLNNAETISLTTNITNVFTLVYKRRFAKFYRMVIRKFSKGSIVVDSVLEFDSTNGSAPNATEVKDTLVTAIRSENLTLLINESSISATVITETNAVSAASANYTITFKLKNDFQEVLSNISSDAAMTLAKTITNELDGFFKGFRNFVRSKVLGFSRGSILVDGELGFNNTIANNPSVSEMAKGLAAAVRNGTVKLAIDPASINIKDSNGTTANRSPVLASMLTALWMTLASLLLSAVMH